MRLTFKTALFFLVAMCVVLCEAQEKKKKPEQQPKPNLSGTWTLDSAKGHIYRIDADSHSFSVNGVPASAFKITMTIVHTEPEIKITREVIFNTHEWTEELVYYSDGRGEKNPSPLVAGTKSATVKEHLAESKTSWKGRRLFTLGNYRAQGPRGFGWVDFTETWELSADGKALTQASEHDTLTDGLPEDLRQTAPRSNIKRVFTRTQ